MNDNSLRTQIGKPGVESWFLRANHPSLPQAIWLKATVLVPRKGQAVAEVWCAVFDGDNTWAKKATVPLESATFVGEEPVITIGESLFRFALAGGKAKGKLPDMKWSFQWKAAKSLISTPVCLIPRSLVDAAFPKNKLLTPAPVITLTGELSVAGKRFDLSGWTGSQGHNWGSRHAPEYAWGQVVFHNTQGFPTVFAEAFTGRVALGPMSSPRLSALTVRRGGERYHFDRLIDVWNHEPSYSDLGWTLKMKGASGEAILAFVAKPERVVCLGYENPDGSLAYCLNSKLAHAVLRVQPVNADAFEVKSEHGAALEFLSMKADSRFPNPV